MSAHIDHDTAAMLAPVYYSVSETSPLLNDVSQAFVIRHWDKTGSYAMVAGYLYIMGGEVHAERLQRTTDEEAETVETIRQAIAGLAGSEY